jgi:hypothetical protein
MLDFDEVGRRMVMRQQMAPTGIVMAHTSIVAPVVGQLLDPEYAAPTALIAHHEAIKLGQTLQRQAELLDAKEQTEAATEQHHAELHAEVARLGEMNAALDAECNRLERRVWWLVAGTVVAAAWLSAIVIAVLIAR